MRIVFRWMSENKIWQLCRSVILLNPTTLFHRVRNDSTVVKRKEVGGENQISNHPARKVASENHPTRKVASENHPTRKLAS